MDKDYCLITDASADLVPEFVEREKINIIPMTYMLDENELIYTGTESSEILRWYYNEERKGKMTHTSLISPQVYENFFRPIAEKQKSILYLSLSSGLSGTYDSSRIAAEKIMKEFPNVKICCVDSLAAAGGIGLLLECAAHNRQLGMSLEDNAKWLEANRLKICHWFMVEDLMYLKRNGRISPTVALFGSMLNVKPILRIENNGSLINFTKKRGTRAALDKLVDLYKNASEKIDGERVYIIHTDNDDGANYLEQSVIKINSSCVITKTLLSPIIGCHTGPGLCAIVHFGKRI